MINVTVKTLDSQNHHFTVDDNLTVEQFKNHIAERVNVSASRQRIIYCGRVLQDNSKLADYDVDGKVVHLVQRAPPNSTARTVRSLTPPPDFNRARGGFRGFDRVGNTVYMGMGSMTFPQDLMDPQQMIPARATHTLSSSRLNVARRMLRNAENVIRQLENPAGGNESTPQTEEPVEEEMTPVIEARVIVPSHGDQPIDGNAILNAVQNTIFPAVGNFDAPMAPSANSATRQTPNDQPSSTSTPRSLSAENLNADANEETPRDGSRQSRLRCRGTEMAALLTTLNQLQFRLAPFLARYQTFMQDDPQVAQEAVQETGQMLNRVSQVLHYFGHAYHSLSDIIINVDQPPPRLLLCRPILIQTPALVQAGIPIQVEAQINLSADRPGPTPNSTTTSSTGTTTNSASATTRESNNASSNATANGPQPPQPPPSGPSISLHPDLLGMPFMPTGSMRVITTPVEIRTLRSNASRPRPTNNNNNTSPAVSSTTPNAPSSAPTAGVTNQPQPTETGQNPSQGLPNGRFGSSNGNLEFFMEVTPEALRGGNLIQSLMQIVGSQLGDTISQAQNQRPDGTQPNQPGITQAQSQPSQSSSGVRLFVPTPGHSAREGTHGEDARSTQTNPTTATHTRSTPRPHVHMTQQAVQGGFDPFLHCYSHHVTQSRAQRFVPVDPQPGRQESSTAGETGTTTNPSSTQSNQPSSEPTESAVPNLPPNIAVQFEDIMRGMPPRIAELADLFGGGRRPSRIVADAFRSHVAPTQRGPPPRGAPDGQSPLNQNSSQQRPQQDIFGFISSLMDQNLPDLLGNGPTLDVYVQSFHPEPYVQGESLIIDLIMLMLRNLRINDLFTISSGNMAPLQRQIDAIQGFFLTEICQNDTTDNGIARATEKLMNDFRPIISALEAIPPRENIDMVRTFEGFFRQRVPDIIRLAINCGSRTDGNNGQNASNLLTTIWRAARELLALAVHCSANGQQGVEAVCEQVMFSTIFNQSNVPNDIHHWTLTSSRTALRTIFQTLDVGTSEIQRYVVRNIAQDPLRSNAENMQQAQNTVESMDVDYIASPINAEPVLATAPIRTEDTEPLPNIIWGSESWHRQTPAEWLPIITRDVQRQRILTSQPPFSDAYLSGMPSKRRKLINKSKPQGSIPQVISESIQQAVTSVGLTSAAPLNIVAQAASESVEIQTAYRSLLQSTVQSNLQNNDDFDPERFPNVAHYFTESSE